MAHEVKLGAVKRDASGKGGARRLRREGKIPAIIYSNGKDPVNVTVDGYEWMMSFRDVSVESVLVKLDLDGKVVSCIVKEHQVNHITGKCAHIDFNEVDSTHAIKTEVHIELSGTPDGVANFGGVLEHTKRTVEVECLPDKLPEVLKVDVSGLGVNKSLTVADIALEDGIKITTPADTVIAHVAGAASEASEEAEEQEEASAEPEVIRKGKEESEEE